MKSYRSLPLFLFIFLYFFSSCRSDESYHHSSDSFFKYAGTDDNLQNILSRLVVKNDTELFVPEFTNKYGVPQ